LISRPRCEVIYIDLLSASACLVGEIQWIKLLLSFDLWWLLHSERLF